MADKFIVKTGVNVKTNQAIDTDGKWIGPPSSYVGPQGAQGVQGAIGPQGVQGVQGTIGVQGSIGSQGAQGPQGATGPQGAQGAAGQPGPAGIQGFQGRAGFQGRQGAVGPQGPQGPQGRQGRQGSAGAAITRVSRIAINTSLGPTGTMRASGQITSGFSDQRLKNVIGPIDNPLKKIQHFDGVYYQPSDLAYQIAHESSSARKIGFIAQEIQKVLPEVVSIAPFDANKHDHSVSGDKYLTINYSKVVPLLIEALKEQKKQIDYIKSKTLKG